MINKVLVDYPKAIESVTVQPLYDAIGMEWEIVLFPPLFAIRFLALGMVPLTILAIGEMLVLLPSHRTLLDRLSGTIVVRARKPQRRGFEVLSITVAKGT
ncbi:MAG TPA: hypothetical protein VH370_11160 [Humisphaera sp.]|nr:hypothetical protein [Humisphaera sp.]